MELLDSRRLTGANLIMDVAGAVMDVKVEDAETDALVAGWRENASRMLDALDWGGETLHERRYPGGVSLAFSAPLDALYAACDVNEWALTGGDFDDALARLRKQIDGERNPKLLAIRDAAAEKGVAFLWDDDVASVGLGTGSQSWPTSDLPDPSAVDWSKTHDIPVVMVTGTNGKSTTVRLMAAMVAADGKVPGLSSTDWIRVGDDVLDTGDYSGPGGARAVLRDPRCEVAILETARGGMLRRGLGFEHAAAVAVLNVAEDHLGEWGIGDLAGLVETKFIISKAVASDGTLILNADETPVRERGRRSDAKKLWFSLDVDHKKIRIHVVSGGDAAFVEDGVLTVIRDGVRAALIEETAIPMTFGGKARFNTSNALAASALATYAGVSTEAIVKGLASFESSPDENPGRGNLFEIDGVTIFADFAHNPHGTRALFQMAQAYEAKRIAVLLGQAGDRTNDDVRALVEATWETRPDLIIVKTMDKYLRGRPQGEMVALIDSELERVGVPTDHIEHAPSEMDAVKVALAWAKPGDLLLLLLHAQREEVLAFLEQETAHQ